MMATRRAVIGGVAATAFSGFVGWEPALSAVASDKPLFADTPLASNRLAARFHRLDMKLPAIPVDTAVGMAPLSGVGGKTRLISLWAEWCVPCLVESREFGTLRSTVANERFDIGLLLTASAAKLDRLGSLARLTTLGAAGLPLLIEPNGGARVAEALAVPPNAPVRPGQKGPGFSLPCLLLVDAQGWIRGRSFGAPSIGAAGEVARPTLTEEEKAALKRGEKVVRVLTDTDKKKELANGRTLWSAKEGGAFLQALADGALERT